MAYEELGLNQSEQLEIRARAIAGAIKDEIGQIEPVTDELLTAKISSQINDKIALIVEQLGISKEEARLILAERLIIERKSIGE